MVFLFLLAIIYIFPRPVFAADPTITIIEYPSNVVSGDTFPVTFTVSSGFTGVFHYNAVGDPSTDISIYPSCASNYNDCSNITIGDTLPVKGIAYAKINTPSISSKIFIRITKSEDHASVYNSPLITIFSVAPTPTPTPINTPTNTPTPNPTSAPTPTSTPTNTLTPTTTKTPTPTPTFTITPTPSAILTPSIEPTPDYTNPEPIGSAGSVLAASDLFVTPTPAPNDNPSSKILPIIFIVLGAIFLGIPLVISKIKKNEVTPQP